MYLDIFTTGGFSGLVASMTKPPSGGPRKAERPRMQVRTPKAEVRCSRPRMSTRQEEVTAGQADRKRPNMTQTME